MKKPFENAGYDMLYVVAKLDQLGIKYTHGVTNNGSDVIWISGLMQLDNPTEIQKRKFWPQIRVSESSIGGDKCLYMRACGAIYEEGEVNWHLIRRLIDTYIYDMIY